MKRLYVIAISTLLILGASVAERAADGPKIKVKLEASAPKLRWLASFEIDRPGFITSFPNGKTHDLVISSFGVEIIPWKPNPDKVRYVPNVGRGIASSRFPVREIKDMVLWPNEVTLLNNGEDVIVPGGFLVPFQNPGHISSMKLKEFRENFDTAKWKQIVKDSGSAYFHRVMLVNVYGKKFQNSSGDRMVSCRGRKPIFSIFEKAGGEMVYLEPTAGGGYDVKVIKEGCDTFFEPVDLNNDGVPEFIIPQFYTKYLVLLWTEEPSGDYTKPEFIRTRVIDSQIGKAFDVQLTDLDLDGELEILATNHQNSVEDPRPELITYKMTLPTGAYGRVTDFMNGIVFDKDVLSEDFVLVVTGSNAGSPGKAVAVKPGRDESNDYPVIVVSGDGSFKAYLLTRGPDGKYRQEIFHDCEGTVGAVHVKDVDDDGWKEVFVPCYDTNKVAVYTFRPAPPDPLGADRS